MGGNDTRGLPFILDAGTPTNLLPRFICFAIGSVYPDARPYKTPYGWTAYEVSCNALPGTFDYTFGDVTIKVSLQDSLYKDVDGKCSFGFSLPPPPEWHVPPILAQPFMSGTILYSIMTTRRNGSASPLTVAPISFRLVKARMRCRLLRAVVAMQRLRQSSLITHRRLQRR